VDTRKIADVHGLIATAIVSQTASLVLVMLCAWRLKAWGSQYYAAVASGSAVMGAFMQFCGVVTFAASGLEKAFCDALDPTPDVSKLPCGMGYGYSAGAAAIFFSMLWAAACWRWVPWGDDGEEGPRMGGSIGNVVVGAKADVGADTDGAAAAPKEVTSLGGGYQSI